jgi:hypothetical protein
MKHPRAKAEELSVWELGQEASWELGGVCLVDQLHAGSLFTRLTTHRGTEAPRIVPHGIALY